MLSGVGSIKQSANRAVLKELECVFFMSRRNVLTRSSVGPNIYAVLKQAQLHSVNPQIFQCQEKQNTWCDGVSLREWGYSEAGMLDKTIPIWNFLVGASV